MKRQPNGRANGRPPRPLPPVEEAPVLAAKYLALTKKYAELVQKMEAKALERVGVFRLAWWAVRSSFSGLALLREGTLEFSNARWTELSQPSRSGGWRDVGPEPRDYPTLREACFRHAESLERARGPKLVRLAREDGSAVLELRLERMEGRSDPRVMVIGHDVTLLVEQEREMERSRESQSRDQRVSLLGQLASGVAHDLNNTLNAMTFRLAMLRQDTRCQAAQGANLAALERILADASAVVGRLQDSARLRGDRPVESVDLARVVSEAVEAADSEVVQKGNITGVRVTIVQDVAGETVVPGSVPELRQLFLNLLLNARDAMPKGGTIRIRGRVEGRGHAAKVVLTVTDEGTGIPAESLPRLFDPFFTTKGKKGTGLGLAMAFGLMRRLGGSIEAANVPSGGAVFTLTFPRLAHPAGRPKAHRRRKAASGHRILLVDDDLENLAAGKAALEQEKQQVDVATGGEEALERIRSGGRYDLVLCDLGMPGLNGWEVAGVVRKLAPGTPFYLLTGWGNEIGDDDPRRRLIQGVLPKPVHMERLREILARS